MIEKEFVMALGILSCWTWIILDTMGISRFHILLLLVIPYILYVITRIIDKIIEVNSSKERVEK